MGPRGTRGTPATRPAAPAAEPGRRSRPASFPFPTAHCGVVGLKPTRARNTLGPDFGEFWGPVTHEHVLTRSVRDTAAVLDATAGPGVGDPYTAPAPARPWRDEVGADPGRL